MKEALKKLEAAARKAGATAVTALPSENPRHESDIDMRLLLPDAKRDGLFELGERLLKDAGLCAGGIRLFETAAGTLLILGNLLPDNEPEKKAEKK